MLHKHMLACLAATALMAAPALAQSTPPSSPAPSPSTTSSGTSGSSTMSSSSTGADSGQFMTSQQTSQWRGSKLMGLDVYGSDNQKIGDISEILFDQSGTAQAVVIGVGGFLGIGEKNVALPFKSVEFAMQPRQTAANTNPPASGGGAPATTGSTGATGTTGTTASGGASTMGTAGTTASTDATTNRGFPDHAMVKMSKADLEKAPEFRYAGTEAPANRSNAGGAGTGGTSSTTGATSGTTNTTAPRP